jgi:Predicted nucleotide-binding protein containing TIR-like domain
MKKKVFVAYCGKQQALADDLRKSLKKDFELFLWNEAVWSGGQLLDNIINAIHQCEYGIALLSCDDEIVGSNQSEWLPRNNVVFELGYFFSHFKKERTAIIRVIDSGGKSPRFPSDLSGWLEIRLSNPVAREELNKAVKKIRARFKDTSYLLSIAPGGASARGFNVLSIHNALGQWGDFEGEFFCVNPSWTLEFEQAAWRKSHYKRYMSAKMVQANYVIDIDRGADGNALDGSSIAHRSVDKTRDIAGIVKFIEMLCAEYKDVLPEMERKLRIYIRPGIRTELTTFVGTLKGYQRGFLFVRRWTEKATVLEARSPKDVATMRDRIQGIMGSDGYFTPSEVCALYAKLVRT